MCLLIVLSRITPRFPLVLGANRDEKYERPATAMTVLRQSGPRVLGGRDELAGGTWLAVNEHGLFAGVTNTPTAAGRDPTKQSRGALPLLLADHRSARSAVDRFCQSVDPSRYNPAWILVGDRHSLFAIDMAGGTGVCAQALPPGMHVLENRALGAPSPKVRRVRHLLGDADPLPAEEVGRRLEEVLGDHEIPPEPAAQKRERARPIEVEAACVHTEHYGTRWSAVVMVPERAERLPSLRYSDGPPCRCAYRTATWTGASF